ncbi:hypothetical protein HQQ81_09675 [Microbacteriaceae bacterium VKM Ac-2854]|nr:hypothetical protein [Microbacteriaceae bacterium VKM Ac-2854]
MQWWNEFVTWLQTIDGHRSIFLGAVVLVSVVIGVLVTAAVVRGSIKRLIAQQQRELKNNVVATLVDAAAEAASWKTLPAAVQVQSDRASAQAETLLRLLPVKGAGIAANWAAHELDALKRSSSTEIGATPASITDFRDRLIEWRNKPARAKKGFITDLERWSYLDTATPESDPAVAIAAAATETATPSKTAAPSEAAAPSETVATQKSAVSTETASAPASTTTSAASAQPAPIVEKTSAQAQEPAVAAASAEATNSAPSTLVAPEQSTIALATPPRRATTDETEKLLADVDALEVRNAPRQVEEFAPVPAVSTPESAPRRDDRGPEPQGTL